METTSITISDARSTIHTLDKRLESWPIIYVTRRGEKVFALVSFECMAAMLDALKAITPAAENPPKP